MRIPALLILSSVLVGCGAPPSSSHHSEPPAVVQQISDELELATVRLTAEANKRLGVTVVPVKEQAIISRRPYPGVVVVPPQSQTALLAPVTGMARYIGPEPLAVGTGVTEGQQLFAFTPLVVEDYALSPTQRDSLRASRITVEQSASGIQSRIDTAQVDLEAARVEQRRARQLFEQKVGSRKRVDDAEARAQLAQETLDAARREQQTLRRITREDVVQAPTPLSQAAPLSGTILRVQVAASQSVSVGQPLLELINLDRLWLRVRLPQSEVGDLERGGKARVSVEGRQLQGVPVQGPPTADPLAATQDLYYLLRGGLSPDQRVEVSLPLKVSGKHRVVPTAAILYDVHGGTWVYTRTEPLVYRRARVQMEFSTDEGQAVLSEGPLVGTPVVVDGAAEIFGIEFGND